MIRNQKAARHEGKRCRNLAYKVKGSVDAITPGTSRSARKQAETLVRRSEAEHPDVKGRPDRSPQIEEFDDCRFCDCSDDECLMED